MSRFTELLDEANSRENVKDIMINWGELLDYYLDKLDSSTYDEMICDLYPTIWGEHLNESMLNKALERMVNEDGSTGGHWSLDQTTSLAERNGIGWTDFNKYDFNYIMNMMYSDYFKLFGNDDSVYFKMALAFLDDKDVESGKAYRYFKNVVE